MPEKTEWFPADVNPVHVGVYEKDFNDRIYGEDYQYWDGKRWWYGTHDPLTTYEQRWKNGNPMPRPWRGLTHA